MKKFLSLSAFLLMALLAQQAGAFWNPFGSKGGGSGDWPPNGTPAGFADGVDNDTGAGIATFTDYGSNNIGLTTATKNVGIGTSAPSSKLDVVGGAHATEITTASGTVTGSDFSVGGSTFVVTLGRVGVGTSSPASGTRMHINSGVIRFSSATDSPIYGQMGVAPSAMSYLNDAVAGDFTYGSYGQKILLGRLGQNSGVAILGGQVGVGTSAPTYRLHVSSTAGETGTIFAVSTGSFDLFRVAGDSISARLPLYVESIVWKNGTVSTSPTGGSSSVAANAITAGTMAADVVASSVAITSKYIGTAQLMDSGVTDGKIVGLTSSKLTGALPALDASALTSIPGPQVTGTVPSSVLPSTVAYTGVAQTFSQPQTITSSVTFTNHAFSVGGSTFVVSGGKMGMGTTNPTAQFDLFGTTFVVDRGKVGAGTASPLRTLHVNQNQGTAGMVFAVSTGTTNTFEAGGSSVQLRVPLYFADGTSMNSAAAVSSQWTTSGSNIYYTGGKVAIGISNPSASLHVSTAAGTTMKLFAVSTGTADVFAIYGASIAVTVPAYFYSDIFFNGAGDAIVSGTNTVRLDAATSKWEFAPSTLSYTSSNGVKYLIARATQSLSVNMSSDTTVGWASRNEPFKTPPAGETWTLTKAWGYSLPAGATVQFNIGIYTSSGAYSGNSVFTLSNASATVNGSFQTSGVVASGMANPTLQAGQMWGIRTPATGHAGGANRLIVNLEYLKQ